MQDERLKILEKYVEEEPNDPFNHYALALEYQKLGDERASSQFDFLIKTFCDYLPSYYTYGMYLGDHDNWQNALEIFQKGLVVAQAQCNEKAQKELKGAIQLAQSELEEW